MMYLREQIAEYNAYNRQEKTDQQIMLKYMDIFDNLLTRENELAHFTASSWIVNKDRTKILMIFHNIFEAWSWTGGHADGEADLLGTALREAAEETGLTRLKPVVDGIFSLETLCVDGHIKKGAYVAAHLHMNLTYLLEADEEESLCVKPDENSAVAWIPIEEVLEKSGEKCMQPIYGKLNEKLGNLP